MWIVNMPRGNVVLIRMLVLDLYLLTGNVCVQCANVWNSFLWRKKKPDILRCHYYLKLTNWINQRQTTLCHINTYNQEQLPNAKYHIHTLDPCYNNGRLRIQSSVCYQNFLLYVWEMKITNEQKWKARTTTTATNGFHLK